MLIIHENKLENLLLQIFPKIIVTFYIKTLKAFKKSGLIIIICLFFLLLISNLYEYHYLNYYISNIDKIIDFYFKK